jgi:signal transduction histidine kinase
MSGLIDANKDIDSPKIEQFEFNELLKQIIGGLRAQFNKKEIALNLLCNQKVTMRTDQYKLSQCIYNILTNAYKFTGPNGKVTIDYREEGEKLIIEIEDTGSGIAEEDLDRLFDAYYRGKNSGAAPGEGIGLYVVKENLNRINGKIEVESVVGKGSKFIITVPVLL